MTNKLILHQQYQLGMRLGGGDMAYTYLAKNLVTNEPVIIKELSLGNLNDWKLFELFEREAQVLRTLNHPRIPKILDYFEDTQRKAFYLVTSKVNGESFEKKWQQGWAISEAQCKKIAREILGILTYLHGLNPPIVHRDIKPSNLMWGEKDEVYLIDFGAVQATLKPEGGSTVVGTFGYMAPEQYLGEAIPASDLYSTGVTLIQLLTGREVTGLVQDNLQIKFRPLVTVSAAFAEWLEKMVAPNQSKRFRSAETALAALTALDSNAPVPFHSDLPNWHSAQVSRSYRELSIAYSSHLMGKVLAIGCLLPVVFIYGPLVMNILVEHSWKHMLSHLLFAFLPLAVPALLLLASAIYLATHKTTLVFDPKHFQITHNILGIFSWKIDGRTIDILKVSAFDFEEHQGTQSHFLPLISPIKIYEGANRIHPFGRSLWLTEKEWLVAEITDFLTGLPANSPHL